MTSDPQQVTSNERRLYEWQNGPVPGARETEFHYSPGCFCKVIGVELSAGATMVGLRLNGSPAPIEKLLVKKDDKIEVHAHETHERSKYHAQPDAQPRAGITCTLLVESAFGPPASGCRRVDSDKQDPIGWPPPGFGSKRAQLPGTHQYGAVPQAAAVIPTSPGVPASPATISHALSSGAAVERCTSTSMRRQTQQAQRCERHLGHEPPCSYDGETWNAAPTAPVAPAAPTVSVAGAAAVPPPAAVAPVQPPQQPPAPAAAPAAPPAAASPPEGAPAWLAEEMAKGVTP